MAFNLSVELIIIIIIIVTCITVAISDISAGIIESSVFKCIQNMNFLCKFSVTTSSVSYLFFVSKCSPKLGCVLYTSVHYTQVKFNKVLIEL